MPKLNKQKILLGRKAVDAYREAHRQLHSKPWYRGIPEEHTPLLIKMVDALEGLGLTSTKLDFEAKKSEILAKFWNANEALLDEQITEIYERVGQCNDCSKCCLDCQQYDANLLPHHCRIYKNRPEHCRNFPTVKQLWLGQVSSECSYELAKKDPEASEVERWS